MADYYPLIARAVGGLDSNTGENRRALYERARGALVNQLRGVDPPLDEDEITRERLALEEALRRCETRRCAISARPSPRPRAWVRAQQRRAARRVRPTTISPAASRCRRRP